MMKTSSIKEISKGEESPYEDLDDSPDSGAEQPKIKSPRTGLSNHASSAPSSSVGNLRKFHSDYRTQKSQSIDLINDIMSIEAEDNFVRGFDPAKWVHAAGMLEKKRDGRMREGWAKRWFVLGKHALHYFLLPKPDSQGFSPLLGDERGQIRWSDFLDVEVNGQDKDYCYLTLKVQGIRKNSTSGILSSKVEQVQIRSPAEVGQLWFNALSKACDSGKDDRSSPTRATPKRSNSTPPPIATIPSERNDIPPVEKLSSIKEIPHDEIDQSKRHKRNSIPVRAITLVPIEQSLPMADPVKFQYFFLASLIVAGFALFSEMIFQNEPPIWIKEMPGLVYVFIEVAIFGLYWILFSRASKHDSVVREARFRAEQLKREVKEEATGETRFLAVTESEIKAACETIRSDVHIAGSSMKKVHGCLQPGADYMTYQDTNASNFKLRVGPNYKKTGAKAPSAASLYTLHSIDLLKSRDKLCSIGSSQHIQLPTDFDHLPNMDEIRKAGIPRLFIVNTQIPELAPSLMGANQPDDVGFSLIFYFVIKPEVIEQMNSGQLSPQMKLFKQYVAEHKKNPDIRRRFKALGIANNAKELGLPSMISGLIDKFNGKPAIINKVAQIYDSGGDMEWFEVDISIFDFPMLARKALNSLKDRVAEVAIRAGFVMQGETDEELPECLLGGAEICGLDFRLAKII